MGRGRLVSNAAGGWSGMPENCYAVNDRPMNDQPVTKADLDAAVDKLLERINGTKADLDAAVGNLLERIHDTETKLLNAFFLYQEHERIQFAKLKADAGNSGRAAELRLDNLEARLLEVERRVLKLPPAA